MFFAFRMRLSPQLLLFDELPNHELFELEGIHEELLLIDGSQELLELGIHDDEPLELIDGNQDDELDPLLLLLEENKLEPSTTPTPKPIPNTARTVEMGYSSKACWACDCTCSAPWRTWPIMSCMPCAMPAWPCWPCPCCSVLPLKCCCEPAYECRVAIISLLQNGSDSRGAAANVVGRARLHTR
jgi:hypothetical protein